MSESCYEGIIGNETDSDGADVSSTLATVSDTRTTLSSPPEESQVEGIAMANNETVCPAEGTARSTDVRVRTIKATVTTNSATNLLGATVVNKNTATSNSNPSVPLSSQVIPNSTQDQQLTPQAAQSRSQTTRAADIKLNPPSLPTRQVTVALPGASGKDDSCQCFHCGKVLTEWARGDDPCVEHLRFFPHCSYARQRLGEDIARDIEKAMRRCQNITSNQDVELTTQGGASTIYSPASMPVSEAGDSFHDVNLGNPDVCRSVMLPTGDGPQELDGTVAEVRSALYCRICKNRRVRKVLQPCGHLVSCMECSVSLHECPECLSLVTGTENVSHRGNPEWRNDLS